MVRGYQSSFITMLLDIRIVVYLTECIHIYVEYRVFNDNSSLKASNSSSTLTICSNKNGCPFKLQKNLSSLYFFFQRYCTKDNKNIHFLHSSKFIL